MKQLIYNNLKKDIYSIIIIKQILMLMLLYNYRKLRGGSPHPPPRKWGSGNPPEIFSFNFYSIFENLECKKNGGGTPPKFTVFIKKY